MAKLARLPRSHKWDEHGYRCTVCGDKDWMQTECSGRPKQRRWSSTTIFMAGVFVGGMLMVIAINLL